ncbi:MAG TPA: hypothetical protein VMV22_08550 [Acidimicrobiales bacterium]|nr:hypothetical protein [Acidimicrobiales bacterium]
MRRNRKTLIAAVGVGALVLAGAAAFTNSLAFSNSNTTVAYGSENVTGATVTSISYGLSTDGTTVNSVTFVATGDTSGSEGDVGFTTGSGNQPTSVCGAGTYDSGANTTTYICSGLTQAVSGITATDIVVH